MILLATDNHYGTHPGRVLYKALGARHPMDFREDDAACFDEPLVGRYSLLILNLISGTCGVAMPGPAAEANVKAYIEAGRGVLLLHGASAAFWQYEWWRPLVGFRWVRADDPDGFPPSTHPHCAYTLRGAKSRHPLCARLRGAEIPEDELYTQLEQTCAASVLMQAVAGGSAHPACYETVTPFGGRIIGYIPGHAPEVVRQPENMANIEALIDWLA